MKFNFFSFACNLPKCPLKTLAIFICALLFSVLLLLPDFFLTFLSVLVLMDDIVTSYYTYLGQRFQILLMIVVDLKPIFFLISLHFFSHD